MSQTNRIHPPSFKTLTASCLAKEIKLAPNSHLLLCVSGGSDSMALLQIMAHLQSEFKYTLSAVGVNHNLRNEAQAEIDIAADYAKMLNVPFYKREVHLNVHGNIQEQARDARYDVIRQVKLEIGADWLVTAHHANDRAETVLMRMIKGTNAQCLGVIPPKSFDLLRPMIRVPKETITKHIEKFKIPYSEDPSNTKVEKYLRSKIRFEIIPELQKINPNIINNLCMIADSMVGQVK